MNIKRQLDTINATYDITGLTKRQFQELKGSYEKQMYIYHNRCPDEGADELLDKLRKMADSDTLII